VDNLRYSYAGLVAIALLLIASSAEAGSGVPPIKTGGTERAREAASPRAISPTWRCEERSILAWLAPILAHYKEDEEKDSTRVEALSRDSSSKSLAIPLLATSMRQSAVAGTRPFHIAWVGGKPPFAVELIGPSGATVASWPQTAEHSVSATVSLEEGFYEVHVTDASGQPVFAAFQATSQPPVVDRRGIEQLPPDLGAALLAARLADIDDGAWQLEAYERLTAEPGGDATRIIAKRLAQGLSVSELRVQGAQLR
jgi:hypothetical protein